MQHTIDAKAHVRKFASWLNMNVACALLKRILQQPIHNAHHALVVRIKLAHAAQRNQLLEVGDTVLYRTLLRAHRLLDRQR